MKAKAKRRFVVLEGCEGSGKSTQMERLKKEYPDAVFFREPGGTEFAEKEVRRLLLKAPISPDLTPFEAMSLFFLGRSHNIRSIIAPALARGAALFSDRYDASSFAYQLYGMEGKDLLAHFKSSRENMGPADCQPGLYIVLDISPEVGMSRVKKRAEDNGEFNHFDARGKDFHARVREGYRRFAELYPKSVKIVNAEQTRDEVWADVNAAVRAYLSS